MPFMGLKIPPNGNDRAANILRVQLRAPSHLLTRLLHPFFAISTHSCTDHPAANNTTETD